MQEIDVQQAMLFEKTVAITLPAESRDLTFTCPGFSSFMDGLFAFFLLNAGILHSVFFKSDNVIQK